MASPLRAGLAALLTLQLITAVPAFGASIAAVDQNGGYSGKVLDKVIAIWAPPPALKGDFTVRLKVSLDGQGKVLDCRSVKASGMEALDSSACGAVRQAAPFGAPPYGMPLDVHLAFWTGTPKGKAQAETLSTEEALRAEVMARTKAEGLMGQQRASSVEERARERAEAIAKNAGQPLPDVKAAPVAPPPRAKAAPGATQKNASKNPRSGLSTDSPATESIRSAKGKTAAPSANATGLTEEEMRLDIDAPAAPAAQSVPGNGKTVDPALRKASPPSWRRTSTTRATANIFPPSPGICATPCSSPRKPRRAPITLQCGWTWTPRAPSKNPPCCKAAGTNYWTDSCFRAFAGQAA